jgi:D-alanyl-lipoteichoic acid acyltransferase DltB (MBOAT superfamily)
MVFSTELFIYGFLPVFFSLYYLIADRRRNWLILAASLIFYAVSAGSTVPVLLASIWINQFLAIRIEPAPQSRRRALLAIGIAVNLLGLALTEGSYRFGLGLGKKIAIADNVGTVVDGTFALPPAQLDAGHAWLGIFCYALQIYFDFSGYSDMAIGLGRLLGSIFLKISISRTVPPTSPNSGDAGI